MRANRVRVVKKRVQSGNAKPEQKDTQVPKVPTLLTVEEVAEQLRIGRNSAYNLVRSGQIRYIKIGRTIRIPQSAVIELVNGDS